jgi:transposase
MLNFPSSVRVFFCVVPIDMRRSFDSLSELVREHIGEDPLTGHLFVFRNKNQDSVKVLYWDRDGYAIWYKRLEKGSFSLPGSVGGGIEIDSKSFSMLLNGFDLQKVKKQKRYAISGSSG